MSPRASKSKGFSLIEMTVVITLVAISAAMIVPVIARWQDSQRRAEFFVDFRNLFAEAREQAILRRTEQAVQFDGDAFRLSYIDQDGNELGAGSARLPAGFEATRFLLAGREVPGSDWQLVFYPDGSAEPAGVEIQDGSGQWYLSTDNRGRSEFGQGYLPDPDQERWSAGEYEVRL